MGGLGTEVRASEGEGERLVRRRVAGGEERVAGGEERVGKVSCKKEGGWVAGWMRDLRVVMGLTEGMGLVRLGVLLVSGEIDSVARRLVGVRGEARREKRLVTEIGLGGEEERREEEGLGEGSLGDGDGARC